MHSWRGDLKSCSRGTSAGTTARRALLQLRQQAGRQDQTLQPLPLALRQCCFWGIADSWGGGPSGRQAIGALPMTECRPRTHALTNCLSQVRARMFNTEVSALQFNVLVTTYEYIMRDRARLSKARKLAHFTEFQPEAFQGHLADDHVAGSS